MPCSRRSVTATSTSTSRSRSRASGAVVRQVTSNPRFVRASSSARQISRSSSTSSTCPVTRRKPLQRRARGVAERKTLNCAPRARLALAVTQPPVLLDDGLDDRESEPGSPPTGLVV